MKIETRNKIAGAVVVLASAAALPAHAAVDYTGITGAFSATDVVTGLMAIGAVLATIYVALKGIRHVLGLMQRG